MIKWRNKHGYVYVIALRHPESETELSYHWFTPQSVIFYYIRRAWYHLSGQSRRDRKAFTAFYQLFNPTNKE